jgi:hypothetical protein
MNGQWIRNPQDLGAAVVFLVIGGVGLYFGRELTFGTAAKMGPGYFPMLLSGLVLVLGLVLAVRSIRVPGPPIERVPLRPILLIVVSVVAFGYLLDALGLAVSAAAVTVLAGYARRKVNLRETLLLAVGLSVFCVLVFVVGLSQPLPLGWWPQ